MLDKLAALTPPIETVLDLLVHYPRRYHDRTHQSDIADLAVGEEATIVAEVQRVVVAPQTRQRKKMVEAVVEDTSGLLNLVFFNQPWREKQLAPGTEVALYGKLDVYRGKRQLTNPIVDVLGRPGAKTGVVVPIYPQSGKADVSTWEIQPVVALTLEWVGELAETLPADVLEELKLVDRTVAFHDVHEPASIDAARKAQRRLRFDEFLRMQVGLVARKRAIEADESGIAHTVDGELRTASWARCRTSSPATSAPPSTRSPPTWRSRSRCTGCCRGRSARARRSSRSPRCSWRCRAGTRAR